MKLKKRNLNLSNKISVLLLQENFTNEEEVCKCLLKEEELLSIKSEIELFNNNMLEIKKVLLKDLKKNLIIKISQKKNTMNLLVICKRKEMNLLSKMRKE